MPCTCFRTPTAMEFEVHQRIQQRHFFWSSRAMQAGDARGRFDVAYSLEFGLGVEADPPRAYALYRELLSGQAAEEVPVAAQVSSVLALISASGRYLASRLIGSSRWRHVPWRETNE